MYSLLTAVEAGPFSLISAFWTHFKRESTQINSRACAAENDFLFSLSIVPAAKTFSGFFRCGAQKKDFDKDSLFFREP